MPLRVEHVEVVRLAHDEAQPAHGLAREGRVELLRRDPLPTVGGEEWVGRGSVGLDNARIEDDLAAHDAVHAADVDHELVVDEDPHVVVAAELEDLAAAVRELGVDLGGEAKVAKNSRLIRRGVAPPFAIKGEEIVRGERRHPRRLVRRQHELMRDALRLVAVVVPLCERRGGVDGDSVARGEERDAGRGVEDRGPIRPERPVHEPEPVPKKVVERLHLKVVLPPLLRRPYLDVNITQHRAQGQRWRRDGAGNEAERGDAREQRQRGEALHVGGGDLAVKLFACPPVQREFFYFCSSIIQNYFRPTLLF